MSNFRKESATAIRAVRSGTSPASDSADHRPELARDAEDPEGGQEGAADD